MQSRFCNLEPRRPNCLTLKQWKEATVNSSAFSTSVSNDVSLGFWMKQQDQDEMGSSKDGEEPKNPAPAQGMSDTAPYNRSETRCNVRSDDVSLLSCTSVTIFTCSQKQ